MHGYGSGPRYGWRGSSVPGSRSSSCSFRAQATSPRGARIARTRLPNSRPDRSRRYLYLFAPNHTRILSRELTPPETHGAGASHQPERLFLVRRRTSIRQRTGFTPQQQTPLPGLRCLPRGLVEAVFSVPVAQLVFRSRLYGNGAEGA